MATPPPTKRFCPVSSPTHHYTPSQAHEVTMATDAQTTPFPWGDAVPNNIRKWFEALAKSHNTAPEYVFVRALVTTAVLMGPSCYVKVGEFYREPTNLFAICIGHPGSGKSQAYKMTVITVSTSNLINHTGG